MSSTATSTSRTILLELQLALGFFTISLSSSPVLSSLSCGLILILIIIINEHGEKYGFQVMHEVSCAPQEFPCFLLVLLSPSQIQSILVKRTFRLWHFQLRSSLSQLLLWWPDRLSLDARQLFFWRCWLMIVSVNMNDERHQQSTTTSYNNCSSRGKKKGRRARLEFERKTQQDKETSAEEDHQMMQ